MPSPSLPSLPPSILLTILTHTPTLATASALSQTCSTIHTLWNTHIPAICAAVLPRIIECHEQAEELFDAQETVAPVEIALEEGIGYYERTGRGGDPEVGFLKRASRATRLAIEKVRRISSNANAMAFVLSRFNINSITGFHSKHQPQPRQLCPSERENFIKSYYRAMTVTTVAGEPHWIKRLAHLNTLEIIRVGQIFDFLHKDWSAPRFMLKVSHAVPEHEMVNSIIPHHQRKHFLHRANARWEVAHHRLNDLIGFLVGLPMNAGYRSYLRHYRPGLSYCFMVDDDWLDSQGKMPLLSDILIVKD